MQRALTHAGKKPEDINYINLHGTATLSNDSAEDAAVVSLFGNTTPASSTKGWTGHTLGAAGITESIFCCLAIEHGFMPKSLNTSQQDPATKIQILLENRTEEIHTAMTNSFGFGGTNCSLVLGRTK
jgi:3-oxoacyl-[acyl-carrier-protein] synthase-1